MTYSINRHFYKICTALSISITSCLLGVSAQAATFAESLGRFSFSNFSQAPSSTNSTALSDSFAEGTGSTVVADAGALFELFPSAQASNFVTNSALATTAPSEAFSESEASLFGSFDISAGSTFSFDFLGSVDLTTSVDQADTSNQIIELASAAFETRGIVGSLVALSL